jgi:hypothetical protein
LLAAVDKLLNGAPERAGKVKKLSNSLCFQHIFLSNTVIWWPKEIQEAIKGMDKTKAPR